jgi:cell division protein FtsZ
VVKMQQPTLQFEDMEVLKPAIKIKENLVEKITHEVAMPVAASTHEVAVVNLLSKTTGEKSKDEPVFFEISSASDQSPVIEFDIPELPIPVEKPATTSITKTIFSLHNKEASAPVSSAGGFLAKPSNIYVEDQPDTKSNTTEELTSLRITVREDEPLFEMQMVVKDSQKAAEKEQQPIVQQTQPIMMSNVEERAMPDETEELRRRAMDRIAKLRNLSFNINAADPNNEFETVPAYLRRNMELHNSIADVESFYSNYTVKSDENNQAEIGTINTFLDGKKPD